MDLGAFKSIPMCDVVSGYGMQVTRGNILCPFHVDKKPSCKIYKTSFYCFSCNTGGDQIKFVQLYENLSFKDALKRLADEFNIPYDGQAPQKDYRKEVIKKNSKELEQVLLCELNNTQDEIRALSQFLYYEMFLTAKQHTKLYLLEERADLIERRLKELEDVRY